MGGDALYSSLSEQRCGSKKKARRRMDGSSHFSSSLGTVDDDDDLGLGSAAAVCSTTRCSPLQPACRNLWKPQPRTNISVTYACVLFSRTLRRFPALTDARRQPSSSRAGGNMKPQRPRTASPRPSETQT